MSEEKERKFGVDFDKKISAQTIIAFLVFFWAVAAAWVDLKRDVGAVQLQQNRDEQFKMEVRNDYINREQLDYIVIERLDRLEKQLEEQLDRIEKKINEE